MTARHLAGRVAVVTGAASGIGRATALRLAADGASVLVADRNGPGAEAAAAEITAAGGEGLACRVDLVADGAAEEMISAARAAFGRIDILDNNAAATDAETIAADGTVLDISPELFFATMRVNLLAPMLACRFAIPVMIAGGGGVVVNVASIAGLTGYDRLTAYSASKAGLLSLTRSVATQFGKQNVRAVSVVVGSVVTPATERSLSAVQSEHRLRHALTPYVGSPEHIASVVAFAVSDDAAFVTGAEIRVDGGNLAHMPALADRRDASR